MLGKRTTTEQQCEPYLLVILYFQYVLLSGRQGMCLNYFISSIVFRFLVDVSRTDHMPRRTLKTVNFTH